MGTLTPSGLTSAELVLLDADTGIYPLVAGQIISADPINKTWKDIQGLSRYFNLPGVIDGTSYLVDITIDGLDVTILAGFSWYARQVWTITDDDYELSVADDAISWIWGCSDGVIRVEQAATIELAAPDGFDWNQLALFAKVTAADGVGVIDLTVQQRARRVTSTRNISDNGAFQAEPREIEGDMVCFVGENYQAKLYTPGVGEAFQVNGVLVVNGRVKVEDW